MKTPGPHQTNDPARLAARFATTAELQSVGFRIMWGNLRRRFPDDAPEVSRRRFRDWLGDAVQPRDLGPDLCDSTQTRRLGRE